MTTIPPPPPTAPRATARVHLRFEDVTQDGRLLLEALPTAFGPTVWRGILDRDPRARALLGSGIVPVLTRFVLEGTSGPVSANLPVEAEGACRIARADDGRFVLDMWADLYAPVATTYGPPPPRGERALAGRAMAECVFTRPFAPPGERRVTRLDFEGAPDIHETRPASPAPESVMRLPPGAAALDPRPRVDPFPLTFGLMHTDSNMHVNSLVYLRLFEEAALRRFVELGRGATVLGRAIEIAYRKPCFAGQSVRVVQQAFEAGGRLGVAATLVDAGDAANEEAIARARPYAFARIAFER